MRDFNTGRVEEAVYDMKIPCKCPVCRGKCGICVTKATLTNYGGVCHLCRRGNHVVEVANKGKARKKIENFISQERRKFEKHYYKEIGRKLPKKWWEGKRTKK